MLTISAIFSNILKSLLYTTVYTKKCLKIPVDTDIFGLILELRLNKISQYGISISFHNIVIIIVTHALIVCVEISDQIMYTS